METLDTAFRLLPVGAELLFAAHGLQSFAQPGLVSPEAVERGVEGAVRERGKPDHAQIDAHRATSWQGPLELSLGLNAHEPLVTRQTDGDVLHPAKDLAAVTVAQPAELGQEQPRVHRVEFDLLRVGITEAFVPPLFLEPR
jgi:hypothetical protein